MSDTKPTTETKATPPPAAPLDLPTAADVAPPAAPLAQGTASTEAAPPPAAGSFFAKMEGFAKPYLDQAKPYVDSAAAKAKPYTDAAIQKGKELQEKISNATAQPEGSQAQAQADGTVDDSAKAASPTGATASEKAKNAFGYGLASLQSAYNQVGAAIDAKTASPDGPGLFTQMSSAVQKSVAAIDKAVITPLNPNAPAATTTAAGSGSGAAATAATTATTDAAPTPAVAAAHTEHPIMTTTNAVPHNNAAGDDAQQ